EELLAKLKELAAQEIDIVRTEIDGVKHSFYKQVKLATENLRDSFVADGGAIEDFVPAKDEVEEAFKAILSAIREKRAEFNAQQEKEKKQHLLEKQHIIEQMKSLVERKDDVSGLINEFRELQQKWKTIGAVAPAHVNTLWREYSQCQEAFWDLVKINNELREYDFKKNLETKTALCEAAEKLADEKAIVSAFSKLQQLHEEWREAGPVAREQREEIWNRFKAASTVINKKHQDYFETLREVEDKNATAKQAIIEQLENVDVAALKTTKQWDECSKKILEWQEEWRKIGFAPRKINQKLFDQYRKACDTFFSAKSAYYKGIRAEFSKNIELKVNLIKQAEELKESTEWKETADKLVQLQKEWKTIGAVPHKQSDELWKRFSAACDSFFEQKKTATSGLHSEEKENLAKKQDIIARIQSLDVVTKQQDALKMLKEMIVEWNAIGYVPIREKEKMHKEYRAVVNKQMKALNVDASEHRLDTFKRNFDEPTEKGGGGNSNKFGDDYRSMQRTYARMKSELSTYENNLGFFTTSSKKGSGLLDEMNKKVNELKQECKLWEEKIKLLENKDR
ncbi:MAG: DUF349 domain-containing protein, partial [Prevotellaceae bacterium]|nr:DUF349 domain-containing protein [Prevotellaceae bacterium]